MAIVDEKETLVEELKLRTWTRTLQHSEVGRTYHLSGSGHQRDAYFSKRDVMGIGGFYSQRDSVRSAGSRDAWPRKRQIASWAVEPWSEDQDHLILLPPKELDTVWYCTIVVP